MDKDTAIVQFRRKLENYCHIADSSWQAVIKLIRFKELRKNEVLLYEGQIAREFCFINQGVLRAYCNNRQGTNYNKNLFLENDFAGSVVSSLTKTPSIFTLEALEDCQLICLDFIKFRELIFSKNDLKEFYIAYLERHWVIEKEKREVALVLESASVRYERFLATYPNIDKRIPLQHIALHLGVTPTQLSRIRSVANKKDSNQHM